MNIEHCLLRWLYFSTFGKFMSTIFLPIIYFPSSNRSPFYLIKLWLEPVVYWNKTVENILPVMKRSLNDLFRMLFLLGMRFLFLLYVMRLEMLSLIFILLDPMFFFGLALFKVKSYQHVFHTFRPYMYGFILL